MVSYRNSGGLVQSLVTQRARSHSSTSVPGQQACREDPGFKSCLPCGNFSGSSHTCDLKIGTPVATLQGTWHHRVSAGTGQPGVNIL